MQQQQEATVEILQAEDNSHVLVVFPWDAEPETINEAVMQAKTLGFTDIVSEGNMNGYTSQGCSDWDYYRLEPSLA